MNTLPSVPSINDIVTIECAGKWPSKSGGTLSVLYKIDFDLLSKFISYDQQELDAIGTDIRGLRAYRVAGVPKGSIGANEWHKLRNEIVYVLAGSVKWTCRDLYGNVSEYIINEGSAVFSPHHVLHTYEALEDDTAISVTANTLFFPEQPETHDSFSIEAFETLAASIHDNPAKVH
jgi:hypothetical protein